MKLFAQELCELPDQYNAPNQIKNQRGYVSIVVMKVYNVDLFNSFS